MSLISGLMLGASIGKAIHGMFLKNDHHGAHVLDFVSKSARTHRSGGARTRKKKEEILPFSCVSATPGRRRYRVAELVDNTALAALLQEHLLRLTSVNEVQVHASTGSILVCSDNESVLDEVERFLRFRLFPLRRKEEAREEHLDAHGGPTVYMEKIYETLDGFSHFILRKTGRMFDLRSIISLILVIRGLRKILTFDQRPTGPQMLWWAAALLRGRR